MFPTERTGETLSRRVVNVPRVRNLNSHPADINCAKEVAFRSIWHSRSWKGERLTNFRAVIRSRLMEMLQGGIALTSPPCNKNQTSDLTKKGLLHLSNTCCEMGVVKIKKNGRGATLIIRKEMAEHVSSTMHVFQGEKYRLLLRSGPTHRKGNGHQKYYLTLKTTVTDP